jgi:hypothetical protein
MSIAAALLYPAWSMRGFRSLVEQAIADTDTLGAAARGFRDETNRWPTTTPAGEAPPELASLSGDEGIFGRAEYTLGWTTWEVVDSVEAPRPTDTPSSDDAPRADARPVMEPVLRSVGAVTVRSPDASLLAELLQHYTDEASFVVDSMWVLVLPERSGALAGP